MTEQEEQQLRALGEEISARQQSAAEPPCISRAFATRDGCTLRFTMQTWIDLEAMRSPLLDGELPEEAGALEKAAWAFGRTTATLTAEEAVLFGEAMIAAIREAFSLVCEMAPEAHAPSMMAPDGFGLWAPIYALLVVDCGLSPAEARDAEVGAAFVLIAAMRRNEGWKCVGTPYALRGLMEHPTSNTQHPTSNLETEDLRHG